MSNGARRPSPAEPVSELRRVKIVENFEPLVDFLKIHPNLVQARPRFDYRREHRVRETVADSMLAAARALPKGLKLAVVEGWRPPYIQRRMHASATQRFAEEHPEKSPLALKRLTNRYVAPMDERVPPPHTTGGAIDIFLADENGHELDHTRPYEFFDKRCYAFDASDLTPEARKNRDLLAEVLSRGKLTNYPSEYWHWSYGDQGWAYRGGHPYAHYGSITPDDWEPQPEDDSDEPLEFLEPPT